jgi:hypothetical protein
MRRPFSSTPNLGPLAFALAAITAAGCGSPPRPPGSDSQLVTATITNGTLAEGDPAVGTVLAGQDPVCTGSLINSHLVLTAAHCLWYRPTAVRFDDPATPAPIPIATVASHPSYERRTQRFDLAILVLASAVESIPPLTVKRARELPLNVGSELRLVGFGATGEDDAPLAKRQGTATVETLDADSLRLSGESRPCNGDSGGPALLALDVGPAEVGMEEALVAVISRGDTECSALSVLSRVDSQFDGFISQFDRLVRSEKLPSRARCLKDSNCEGLLCANAVDSLSIATCSNECRADDDCGERGFICDAGARLCRRAAPLPGGFLTPCTADGECDSVICASAKVGEPRVCTRPCRPDDASTCDASSSCVSAVESPAPYVCLPRSELPSARLGTGCDLSGALPARRSPGSPLGLLGMLGMLGGVLWIVRRRRPPDGSAPPRGQDRDRVYFPGHE